MNDREDNKQEEEGVQGFKYQRKYRQTKLGTDGCQQDYERKL